MADDDPVVQEFDVFLSKSLEGQLHIYQYPLRPKSATYDDSTIVEARVKPQQQKVELELALDTHSGNFDHGRAEEIARTVNSIDADPYFPRDFMDRHMLTSSKIETCDSRYAVGIIRDNELHLTPVASTLHLRPHYHHLDVGVSKSKDTKSKGANMGDSSQEEEEEEAKHVTVRFARTETDKAKKAREKSYHFVQQKTADEAWINVSCNSFQSEESLTEIGRLRCLRPKGKELHESVPKTEYLKMFIPNVSDTDFDSPNLPSSVIPMAQLHSMPLGDQVKTLLVNAKVMKFSQLMMLVSSGAEPLVVMRTLQQVAVLVQGNWAVKSDVLFPKGSCSTLTGIPAEDLCKARDYILWRFTRTPTITRKEVSSSVKLPSEDLKDILEQMARVRPVIGWTFSLPNDDIFLKRYPDVAQRQQMIWESKSHQLEKLSNPGGKPKEEFEAPTGLKSPTRIRQRKRTKSSQDSRTGDGDRGSRADPPAESMEVDAGASGDVAPKTPACPTRNGGGGGAVPAITIKQEVLDSPRMEVENGSPLANGDAGETTTGMQEAHSFLRELNDFVRDSFVIYPCLTAAELRRLLTCKMAQSPPGHVLRKGVTDMLLEATCLQVGAEQLNVQWALPLKDPAIFVSTKTGDQLDLKKKSFIDLFRNGPKMRKGIIRKALEEALGVSISDLELGKLLKDFCTPLKNGYHLIRYVNAALVS